MLSNVKESLVLLPTAGDFRVRASALPYNALCVELRDLYRILDGMGRLSEAGTLAMNDVTVFYDWFEGFFGIMTALFDMLEDVVFAWIEKIGSLQLDKALSPKRRKAKQARAKDVCWDILELKLMLQKTADKSKKKSELSALVYEVADEADLLALRLLTFVTAVQNELPLLLSDHFEQTERGLIEETMICNLKSSNPGKFVLGAFTRGIATPEARSDYLTRVYESGKNAKKNAGLKEYKKFHSRHVDLADTLAATKSVFVHRPPGDTTLDRTFAAGDSLY
jgi:hypothetical protein